MHITIQLKFFIDSLQNYFYLYIGGFGNYFTKKDKFKKKSLIIKIFIKNVNLTLLIF